MRVLHVSSAKEFGGGERHFVDLTGRLQARGHRVFAALRPNASWRERLDFLPADDFLSLPLKNAVDLASAVRLARFVERAKIEVVCAHLARDYSIAALAVRLARNRAKLVLTRHVLFPLKRWHKFVLPGDARFIAVSKAAREQLLKQKIVALDKVHLIYNGVDVARFATARASFDRAEFLIKLGLSPARRFVGMIGEIVPNKGQTDFVRAAREIADALPDVDFLIAGLDNSPDARHKRELEKLIDELNLRGRVHFLGWQPDAAQVLCAFDVFVSASRVESFGLAIVEAMAARVAIAATASAGAREILVDDETGKLAPVGDAATLAKAVKELLENPQTRLRLAEKAQTAARERFDLNRMTERTEKVYRGEI